MTMAWFGMPVPPKVAVDSLPKEVTGVDSLAAEAVAEPSSSAAANALNQIQLHKCTYREIFRQ